MIRDYKVSDSQLVTRIVFYETVVSYVAFSIRDSQQQFYIDIFTYFPRVKIFTAIAFFLFYTPSDIKQSVQILKYCLTLYLIILDLFMVQTFGSCVRIN